MLFYLDNWQSTREGGKGGLNENYARELMELHTLGVDGGYTQDDVHEVARAFTGWSIDRPRQQASYLYRPFTHDRGAKTVLGVTLPAGGKEGDGERVLDMLASHPSTAHFIALKLCRKFVSDSPPDALVHHVAEVFRKSGGDLRQTYAAIFSSPDFWSDDVYAAKTKTPFELAASAIRALGGTTDGGLPLYRQVARMGEPLFRAQPPTGYPEEASKWINAGALVSRINFGIALAHNRIPGTTVDLRALVAHDRGDPERMIDALARALLLREPSELTRATIARVASGGDEPFPDGERRRPDPRLVAGLLLGSPEFQKQ
jgi:uncharacterized protein (DUF1800 family)